MVETVLICNQVVVSRLRGVYALSLFVIIVAAKIHAKCRNGRRDLNHAQIAVRSNEVSEGILATFCFVIAASHHGCLESFSDPEGVLQRDEHCD